MVIGGGNIDVTLLSRIIERGLVKDGRLVRLRVHLGDFPGALHRLTGILAQHRANIVETDYDRAYHGVGLGETAIEITMETRGPDHIAQISSLRWPCISAIPARPTSRLRRSPSGSLRSMRTTSPRSSRLWARADMRTNAFCRVLAHLCQRHA